jgi:Spy/CpxP family protein refolding chaperone
MKHILLLIFVSGLIAQDFDHPERDHEHQDGERHQRMEMMMVWKLTDELDLTPEQAEKFFPRFRQHRNELDEVRKMQHALGKEMKQNLKKDKEISENDVESTVKKISELRKKSVDLESNFILGMKDVLSPRQLANFSMFKQKMMKNIRGELKEHHGKKGKRGKMQGRRGGKKRRGY